MSFSVFSQAEEKINECMSDIYFANGINTSKKDARKQLDELIYKQVLKSKFNLDEEKMTKTVNFKLAYNNTMGIAFDLLESYNQKKAEHGTFWWTLSTIYDVYGGIAKQGLKEVTSEALEEIIVETLKKTASQFIVDPLIDEVGLTDLAKLIKDLRNNVSPSNVWSTLVDSVAALENYDVTKQLGNYKNSIKLGHSAIVIAHSQGNLFTNVVYDKIATSPEDKWMTKYFYMIGVASPAGVGTGPKGIEIVTFDNDPITLIPDHIGTPIDNPLRYIVWNYSRDNNQNSTKPSGCFPHKYAKGTVPQSCVDPSDTEYDFWSAFDTDIIDFHLFEYYMNTEVSRKKIINFVKASLDTHKKADSQWKTNEEFDKNTCNYRITVKHRYDPSIEMGEKVYPFNLSKKLYQAKNKAGAYEYVKASCGGENILETWDGKKDNECLMIDNVEKEKISQERYIFYGRYFYYGGYISPHWPYEQMLVMYHDFWLDNKYTKPLPTNRSWDVFHIRRKYDYDMDGKKIIAMNAKVNHNGGRFLFTRFHEVMSYYCKKSALIDWDIDSSKLIPKLRTIVEKIDWKIIRTEYNGNNYEHRHNNKEYISVRKYYKRFTNPNQKNIPNLCLIGDYGNDNYIKECMLSTYYQHMNNIERIYYQHMNNIERIYHIKYEIILK